MSNETAPGSFEGADGGGYPGRGEGEPAPLQSRAKFLENWGWASVTRINEGLCERGGAQRGINSETHGPTQSKWEEIRTSELTLLETLQFLKSCHRRAPFLFFNGNTFAEIGRALSTALFSDLPFQRRKEAASAVAHYITGVLEEQLMVEVIEALSRAADFKAGDRVRTFRGSTRGVVLRILKDGRVVWRPDGSKGELIGLPESLLAEGEK
jgi:hypothetical protein